MIERKKLLSTLVFAIFLTGSTIIYYTLGRWVAIGVALEVLAIYIALKIDIKSIEEKDISDDEDIDK